MVGFVAVVGLVCVALHLLHVDGPTSSCPRRSKMPGSSLLPTGGEPSSSLNASMIQNDSGGVHCRDSASLFFLFLVLSPTLPLTGFCLKPRYLNPIIKTSN